MLILTRKSDEAILIGDDIVIRVLEIKGGQVRLGIEAPRDKRIYREELYQRIVEENLSSSQAEPLIFNEIKEVFKKK